MLLFVFNSNTQFRNLLCNLLKVYINNCPYRFYSYVFKPKSLQFRLCPLNKIDVFKPIVIFVLIFARTINRNNFFSLKTGLFGKLYHWPFALQRTFELSLNCGHEP